MSKFTEDAGGGFAHNFCSCSKYLHHSKIIAAVLYTNWIHSSDV